MVVRLYSWESEWMTTALRTITPKHRDPRQITIEVSHYSTLSVLCANLQQVIGEGNRGQWLNLDRLLVQLCESRPIGPRVWATRRGVSSYVWFVLPEATGRGMVDPVEKDLYEPQ
jgi:hypothetical protein